MWLTKTWVLLYVACAWPGMDGEVCTPHYIDGFVSQRMCEEAVPTLSETIQPLKPDGMPVHIDAQCVPSDAAREV